MKQKIVTYVQLRGWQGPRVTWCVINDSFFHYLLLWNLFAETYPFSLVHRAIPELPRLNCDETGYNIS